jgi:hypothetical protein
LGTRSNGENGKMQFVWMGFLKPGQPIDQSVQQQISGFLEQPYIPIDLAGVLRDSEGQRAGYLVTFEAEDRAAAEALVGSSPIREAGLYADYHLFEFQNEVG